MRFRLTRPLLCLLVLVVLLASCISVALAQGQPLPTQKDCSDFPTYPPEKSIPGGLARTIYEKASRHFRFDQNENDWKPCDFYYSELVSSLGLPEETELSRAKVQLSQANEQLLKDFYIKGYRWFEPKELSPIDRSTNRWQIRYYPGVRFTHNQMLELWYEVLSPDNNLVSTVMNNRSVLFVDDRNSRELRDRAQPILEKAVDCSRNLGVPRDIIASLLNLGCFHYISKDFAKADTCFTQAIKIARSTIPPESPALAPLVDFEALSARSLNDFDRAEKLYAESLQIRSSIDGYAKPQVAHSLVNLACLYQDWSYAQEDPNIKRKYQERAQELLKRADEIMNPPINVARYKSLRTEAAWNHDRAASSDPEIAWKYKAKARELSKQADDLQNHLVLVNSTDRSDIVRNMIDLSHGLGRPTIPTLTVNQGTDKLAAMVDFAKSISKKCETPPPPPPPEEVGLATILGNWAIPTDVVQKAVTKTMHRKETVLEGDVDVVETREEKVSPVENVSIYLCRYPDNPNSILAQIQQYGAAKGLAWAGLGDFGSTHGWPANHLQAEQLQAIIDSSALSISKKITKTDKNGDYKFEGVPKGDYLLYGSICTKSQCLIWLIPPEKISVRRVDQFRFDFIESTGIKIWEEGHPAAPATPIEYFNGTATTRSPQKK